MNPVFKKLNYKNQSNICVLQAPAEFEGNLREMEQYTQVAREWNPNISCAFLLLFVKSEKEVGEMAEKLKGKLEGDVILWFAYPKKSSKKYSADISRDHGWQPLGELGFEGVRMVSLDQDWSAVRFRHVSFIKSMKRDKVWAMSEAGKKRTE